jgi:Ca2+/H+ antiporter, TMEM165/GDT1 family
VAAGGWTGKGPVLVSGVVLLVTVFGVTLVAELPDKSMFASLVLGTRYRPVQVWLGVAAAFGVHVVLAVTAGGLLMLAPRWVVDGVTGALFLGGAAWMVRSGAVGEGEPGLDAARLGGPAPTVRRVFWTCFAVVFAGEWGDVTQITTASFAAHYHRPVVVGAGALAALWAVSAVAVFGGAKLLARVPARWVGVAGTVTLTGLGVYSLVEAVVGLI